ncbi:MAG: phage holin family protein [Clostridia bacterium]|nr:phage holin family protein [Clostridia bacterium]
MTKLFFKYISIILSIFIVSKILSSVSVTGISAILVMGLVLLLVNLLLKPIFLVVALPFNLITFGLCSFVVNALTIMIADCFVSGVSMGGFLNSLLAAFLIVIFNNLLIDTNKPAKHRSCD